MAVVEGRMLETAAWSLALAVMQVLRLAMMSWLRGKEGVQLLQLVAGTGSDITKNDPKASRLFYCMYVQWEHNPKC